MNKYIFYEIDEIDIDNGNDFRIYVLRLFNNLENDYEDIPFLSEDEQKNYLEVLKNE